MALAAVVAAIGLASVGSPDVTKTRVEQSLTPAFTNLYVHQQQLLGHPQVTTETVQASSSCDRGGPLVADTGAGSDWICEVTFNDDARQQQTGKFELQVHANACYTANGPAKLLGSFTITDTTGHDVPNPVNAFDVCFDPDAA
jgi:hypothetical protein